MNLTEQQIERYSRNILVPEIGGQGQERLLASRVLCVGAGGLGSPVAYYLAAAGVGTLGLLDSDRVDISNLQRQILHTTKDIGNLKTGSAREKLQDLNPDCHVVLHPERLEEQNAPSLIKGYDVVVDGSDNFPTRYLVNDTCVALGKPLVSGAILRWEGQVMTILPHQGPCYRCLFPDQPDPDSVPACQESGVLGAIAGIIGSIQAAETIKILLGRGEALSNRLLILNALTMRFREVAVGRDTNCAACSAKAIVLK